MKLNHVLLKIQWVITTIITGHGEVGQFVVDRLTGGAKGQLQEELVTTFTFIHLLE